MVRHIVARSFVVCVLSCFAAVNVAAQTASGSPEVVPGELLVKMKGNPSNSKSAAFLGKMAGRVHLKATFGRLNMHHLALAPGQDLQKTIEELRKDPDVEYVEPNYILHKADGEVAGADPRKMSQEEALSTVNASSSGSYAQSGADTKVSQGWSQMSSSSSDEPIVAVIDTGVDYTHSVFVNSGAMWVNPGESGTDANGHSRATNGIDDDGNGYIDDYRGWNFHDKSNNPMDDEDHGTHVAGIILGVTQDIFASSPETAKIRLMPLKFLGSDGSGSTSDAISAIYYAVNNGAQVINNSWGGADYSQSLHDALAYAYTHNVVIVVAAGNNSNNNDVNPSYPASYPVPSLISVAASNDWDSMASFSNYGVSTVHLSAPGVSVESTIPGNRYQYMSGTSMAAPFVAGVAALAYREAPQLSGYQIRNLVVNAVDQIAGLTGKVSSGGRANSAQAIIASKAESTASASQPNYVASSSSSRSPASDDGSSAKVGGCGMVSTSVMSHTFNGNGPQGPNAPEIPWAVAMTLLPILVWQVIRMRATDDARNRRRHERFVMNSEIKVRMGDRELVGQLNTISLGGLSFKADAMLEKGGVVTLQIASPDGATQVQVEGAIVWSEENQSYGVQFAGAKDSALDSIRGWTRNLVKAG